MPGNRKRKADVRGPLSSDQPAPKKTKGSKKATKAEDDAQKSKATADRESHAVWLLKSTALKSRFGDIRCCHKDIFGAKELMAGYLKMKDTEELHAFLRTSATAKGPLKSWNEHYDLAFGCLVGKKSNGQPRDPKDEKWLKNQMFSEIVAKPSKIPLGVLTKSLPLDKEEYPETSKLRGYVSWIVTMYQVMIANPAYYSDIQDPNVTKFLGGFPIEDWNRAYQTLRAFHRVHSDSGASSVDEDANRRPKTDAQEPIMLTNEDITSLKMDKGGTGAQLLRKEARRLLVDSDPEDDSGSAEENDDMNAKVAAVSATLAKVTASSSCRLKKADENNVRPPISVDEQITVCEILGKRVRQLYPGPEVVLAPPHDMEEPELSEEAMNEKQRAAVEEPLGDPEEVTDEMRSTFWKQQLAMNAISSKAPGFTDSCDILHFDPDRPAIRDVQKRKLKRELMKHDVVLFPWQVQAVAWLKSMEESKLKAALLADDMGLGKTITTIAFMLLMPIPEVSTPAPTSSSTAVNDGDPPTLDPLEVLRNRKHKPTLYTFPSNASSVWKEEFTDNFPYCTTKYWFGSRNTGDITTRDRTLASSPHALIRYVKSLPDEPRVRNIAVLTTLQTLRDRSVYPSTKAEEVERLKFRLKANNTGTVPNNGDVVEEEENEEDDNRKEVDLTDTERSDFKSYLTGIFGRVIVDEAHFIKSVHSLTNRAIELLEATSLIFITGTPMINRPIDYLGLLSLVWKESLMKGSSAPTLADYIADNEANAEGTALTAVNDDAYFRLLNPHSFFDYMSPRGGEQVDTGTASIVIPPVFRRFQLRRTPAHEVEIQGIPTRIGASMRPYTVHTVELQMSDAQSVEYFNVHNRCALNMGLGQDENTEDNLIDMEKHRRLSHAILNPQLDNLARNCKVKEVNKWYERYNDHGATFLFKKTRPAPLLPTYLDRVDMASYMCMLSAKLGWLAKYCSDIVNSLDRKLLIFCNWPMTVFDVEAFLVNLNFDVLSIRSAHKAAERDTARNYFRDPNHPARIMVISIQVSGASVNMHTACSDCIFLDVPGSCGQMFQAMCRLFRLGQKRIGHAIILTLDRTYDQAIQARAANKMLAQIAGAGGITANEIERNEYRRTNAECVLMKDAEVDSLVIHDKCVSMYVKLCGQRSSRHEWIDIYDVTKKDTLEEEMRWRGSQGLSMRPPKGYEPPPEGYKSSLDLKKSKIKDKLEKREKAKTKAEKEAQKAQEQKVKEQKAKERKFKEQEAKAEKAKAEKAKAEQAKAEKAKQNTVQQKKVNATDLSSSKATPSAKEKPKATPKSKPLLSQPKKPQATPKSKPPLSQPKVTSEDDQSSEPGPGPKKRKPVRTSQA